MSTLHLSVINDGAIYADRMDLARAHLGDFSTSAHARALRPIVNTQATADRRQFGSKFSARDISDTCAEVAEYDRRHLLEILRDVANDGAAIAVSGRKWFDRVNGNTYHACDIWIGEHKVHLPMQYGYGDQWMWTAHDWLIEREIIQDPGRYENGMRKGNPLATGRVSYGEPVNVRKRDL